MKIATLSSIRSPFQISLIILVHGNGDSLGEKAAYGLHRPVYRPFDDFQVRRGEVPQDEVHHLLTTSRLPALRPLRASDADAQTHEILAPESCNNGRRP